MSKRLVAMVVVVAALTTVGVRAQEVAGNPAASEKRPAKPIMFSVDARGEYTDNRDSVKNGKENNFDFYVQPRLDANFDWSSTILIFSYAPSYRFRSNPSDLQNKSELFHDVSVDLTHKPSDSTQLKLKDTFTMADDPSVQQNGTTVRGDTSYNVNNAEVGLNQRFDRRTELDIKGDYMVKKYKETQYANTSDESNFGGALTLLRQVQRTVAVVGTVNYKDYSYKKISGVDRGFGLIGGALGLDNMFTPESSTGFRAGYQQADYKDSKLDNKGSPYADAYLKYAPIPSFRLAADAVYSIMDSAVYPYSSQDALVFQLSGAWDADPMVTIDASLAYSLGKYSVDTVDSTLSTTSTTGRIDGDQNSVIASAGVSFRISNDMSVKLEQVFENLTSDVRDGYTKNTTVLSGNVKF